MFILLEKILKADEREFTEKWGFIDTHGHKIMLEDAHEIYAAEYLDKHNLDAPDNGGEVMVAKFLKESGYVRFFIGIDCGAGFTIVNKPTSLQMATMRRMSRSDWEIVFDIVDEEAGSISSGTGIDEFFAAIEEEFD